MKRINWCKKKHKL